ncbi:hypothetical protein C0J50_19955, partial [Silurus asotus]
ENYSSLQEFTEDSQSSSKNKPKLFTSHNGQAGISNRAGCIRQQMVIFLMVTLLISFCVNIALAVFLFKQKGSISPNAVTTESPPPREDNQSLKLSALQERFSLLCYDYTNLGKTCSTQVKPCMPCPDGWRHTDGKCYYFSKDKLDWIRSKESCASMGSHLTILHTHEQHVSLHVGKNSIHTPLHPITQLFLFYTELTVASSRYWNDWDEEPNNHQSGGLHGEDCAVLNSHSKSWYDVPCENIYKHICEMDAIA